MTERTRALWAVALAAGFVGTTGTTQALFAGGATPLGVGAARAFVGAAALAVIARGLPLAMLRTQPVVILVGAIGVGLYQPAFFVGVDRLGVALGTILAIGSGPGFAGIFAFALGKPPSPWWTMGTLISVVAGAAMVWFARGGAAVTLNALGIIAALGAGCGYALYTTTTNVLTDRGVDATRALAWQFVLGAIVLLPVFVLEPFEWLASPEGIAVAVYLGVVTIGVAYGLVGYAVPRLGAPLVTTIFQVEPVAAALLSVVVLDERLPTASWISAAMVLVGVQIASRLRQPIAPRPQHQ